MPQHILTSKLTSNPSTTGTLPHKAILTTPHLKLIKDQSLAAISQERSPEETTNNLCHADCQQLLRGGQGAVGCFHQQACHADCQQLLRRRQGAVRCEVVRTRSPAPRTLEAILTIRPVAIASSSNTSYHDLVLSHPREVLSNSLRSSVTPNGAS
jgi:hypothetical protein